MCSQTSGVHIDINGTLVKSSVPNNLVLMNTGEIVSITKLCVDEGFILGQNFEHLKSLFLYPCDSKLVRVYKVNQKNLSPVRSFEMKAIRFKCIGIFMKAKCFSHFTFEGK